jgi:hypothetical protein
MVYKLGEPIRKQKKHVKRYLAGLGASIAILAGAAVPALAAGTDHFGPFPSSTTDGSTCGIDWATDQVNRDFTVHDNGDGTFKVTEQFKDGTFTTLGTTSPGACETTSHHGTTVLAGVKGSFQGFLTGTVTSSTYNPNACTPTTCNTTSGFLTTVFGAQGPATFTCNLGYAGCDFNFEYNSSDKSLQYHHWQDKEDTSNNSEQFIGDIANS